MKNKYFDIVVKKISKYKNRILEIEKIKNIIQNILDTEYSEKKTYKMIYYLKNRGFIESLKKEIFFVKNPEKTYKENELIERFYREMLKRHCNEYIVGKRYIGGIKALELNISSYSIPEEITIINSKKQATEIIIGEKKGLFKTYTTKNKNLFPLFKKYTHKINIHNQRFCVAKIELATIETLFNQSIINKGYSEELIKKITRKLGKSFDTKIYEELLKNNKHHSSINSLYKICQITNPSLAENLKKIIKKYSYFI